MCSLKIWCLASRCVVWFRNSTCTLSNTTFVTVNGFIPIKDCVRQCTAPSVNTVTPCLFPSTTGHVCILFTAQVSLCVWGTRWRSCLRYSATSRKVAGSFPDGVTGIFHWHNPSIPTMALGLTQPPTEMSTSNISLGGGGKGGRCVGLTTLPPSCADCHEIWEPQRSGTLRACPGPCRDCFILLNTHTHTHTHTHIYRVIQNYCRDFNNLSYAIHLR